MLQTRRFTLRRGLVMGPLLAALAACTSNETQPAAEQTVEAGSSVEEAEAQPPILDRTRDAVTSVVTRSAQAVDNVFGTADVNQPVTIARGRLSLGAQYDDYNGFQDRLRLRARIALPAVRDRFSLLVGRTNADDFVDGQDDGNIDQLPEQFNDDDDDDWIVGIGFNGGQNRRRGWDLDAGVKLRTPLEPYVRANYYWNREWGDRWLLRMRPRVFWQNQRGAGASLQQVLDFAVFPNWLIRGYGIMVADEDQQGVSWTAKLTSYHRLSSTSALSFALFGNGAPEEEVAVEDYGIEVRYRRQFLREWLYVELQGYVDWPREFLIEEREANPGIGVEFEMQFGDGPQ